MSMNSWKLKFLEVLESNGTSLCQSCETFALIESAEQFLTGLTESAAKNIHLTNQTWLLNATLRSVVSACGIVLKYSCSSKE